MSSRHYKPESSRQWRGSSYKKGGRVRDIRDADAQEVDKASEEETFDPEERAKEKQASRDKDAEDLASGKKTAEQLRQENGKFAFPNAKIDWKSVKKHY